MRGDVDVIYQVAKDLAWQYLKRHTYSETIRLAVYKSCVDMYITRKTVWNTIPLLMEDGALAIWCNYQNLSQVVLFCEKEGWPYDVVLFYGPAVRGQQFRTVCSSAVPFVLVYKNEPPFDDRPNMVEIVTEEPLDEIMSKLLTVTTNKDVVMFIGDAIAMAPITKKMGRDVVVFGDEPMSMAALLDEGVTQNEPEEPWRTKI